MTKYYYKKYEIENYNWYEEGWGFYYNKKVSRSGYYQDLRKGYSFNNLRGYYGTGDEYAGSGGYRFRDDGSIVYKYENGERKDGKVYYEQYKMDAIVTQKQRRGNYIETLQVEDGIYPNNGIQDGYWYVKGELVFPLMKIKMNNELKTSVDGWVKIDGVLRSIDNIWIKEDGILKLVK